ncbi:hypothetical protein BU26DRAFT_562942 [Trematosphaeria pertusa]|uniref:Uncharacterized protein n=1 Tax=Trematosphaeria pertusa TaxID=390896 RepID=A0A6A6IKN4_9PLEO|nr:uncharacterized protein BU26DRAFT_562942 [Trematosphaeria pertusa]KAF2250981.1 hypothetical protein BU26DRAFT_562942 [Trematosphaeria pertusa]
MNQRRGSCPNCRRELFEPERLRFESAQRGNTRVAALRDTRPAEEDIDVRAAVAAPLARLSTNASPPRPHRFAAVTAENRKLWECVQSAFARKWAEFTGDLSIIRWQEIVNTACAAFSQHFDATNPLSGYITLDSLINLSACAALVEHCAEPERVGIRHSDFNTLVTLAGRKLRRVQSSYRSVPVQYERLLNYKDPVGAHQLTEYQVREDEMRARWIVGLRVRTRGLGADPYGRINI